MTLGRAIGGLLTVLAISPAQAALRRLLGVATVPPVKTEAVPAPAAKTLPQNYDPKAHSWAMIIDVDKCIGCGYCAQACKQENRVIPQPFYFRTWIERYIIKRPSSTSIEAQGEAVVDSPNGGIDGFPPSSVPRESILKSFFVPKLCNHCTDSPCIQACPVGATFDSPDGVVLVDPTYCIGCGFCIQACPYGCRFLNPVSRTAEKCTFCYHRTTHGLRPACVEVCPTGSRMFGDMKDAASSEPLRRFVQDHKMHVLKPHLGTHPKLLYAGLDKEVR
jgi:tetrathionate reductase subunit B